MNYGKIRDITKIRNYATKYFPNAVSGNAEDETISFLRSALNNGNPSCEGYCISTDQLSVCFLISDEQYSSEDWGIELSETEKSIKKYIGTDLLSIEYGRSDLEKIRLENGSMAPKAGGVRSLNFHTSKGVFSVNAWNYHTGKEPHSIFVEKNGSVLMEDVL